MNWYMAAVFGFVGAVLGLLIPQTAEKIVLYKCKKKCIALAEDERFSSLILTLPICLLNMFALAFAGWHMDSLLSEFMLTVLIFVSIVIAIIDLRIQMIPNELVLLLIIEGAALRLTVLGPSALLLSALCMVVMMILFCIVAGAIGFGKVGAGDVKLAGAMGVVLGYPGIINGLMVMSAAFFLYCVIGFCLHRLTMKTMVPLAPFMMSGMVVSLLLESWNPILFQ